MFHRTSCFWLPYITILNSVLKFCDLWQSESPIIPLKPVDSIDQIFKEGMWVVTLCSLICSYQCLEKCIASIFRKLHGIKSQNTTVDIFTTVRTSNFTEAVFLKGTSVLKHMALAIRICHDVGYMHIDMFLINRLINLVGADTVQRLYGESPQRRYHIMKEISFSLLCLSLGIYSDACD
jgi:hypothetical protein